MGTCYSLKVVKHKKLMQKKRTKFNFSYSMRFEGLTSFNVICFSCFTYIVTIRFNEFKRNKLHVSRVMIVTEKMFGYCGGLRAVSLFCLQVCHVR